MIQKHPTTIKTLSDILSCISAVQTEEAKLSNSLTELLNAKEPILGSLNRLSSLAFQIDELHAEATLLSDRVSSTATTAKRVGSRVRTLDEEMGRVREAGERVGLIMELKSSLSALHFSIDSQDWESAARHCAKAMSLPLEVISGPFAETAVPTSENHLPPVQTLQAAREKLLSVFRQNFEQASRSRDSAATSRFFKLFPAIGWESEGLEAYATFVVDLVRVKAPSSAKTSSSMYFITALTALFESIAMIVDQHQPVVIKYYGSGKMSSVVKRLLEECDRVSKGLINGWEEDRSMKRKISETANNQPFLSLSSNIRRPPHTTVNEENDVDLREIDKTLNEVSGMAGRWNLFRKFITEALKDDQSTTDTGERNYSGVDQDSPFDGLDALSQSNSHKLFDNLITTYYLPLEIWYTRTTLDKAHRMSSLEVTQTPVMTTTPDDVFYILKSVTYRALTTGSILGVQHFFAHLREIIDRDYIGIIKKKLDDVYRNTSGQIPNPRGDKAERENRLLFMTLLNDLDISSSHMEKLAGDLTQSSLINQHFVVSEQQLVKQAITSFATQIRLRSAVKAGVEQLFNQLLRPKMRNLISDIYRDVSYVLDEDGYTTAEYQGLVRKRFIKAWEGLVDGYMDTLSSGNYRLFLILMLDVIIRPWEKFITSLRFTELGAIRFDRDLRSIMMYLVSQTAFGDAREKFTRLQQISTLLNLDNEENVDEFYNGSGITWKLTVQEARAITSLRN